jgi:hypothetical protein
MDWRGPVDCGGIRAERMMTYLFSCEHATCAVPEAHRELFRGQEDAVASTEGWEPGVLNLAQGFSMKFRTPLVHGDVTRLLINLEHDGDARWSRFSSKLPEATRNKIADRHERPFRAQLAQRLGEEMRRNATVLHLLLHTSPEIDGRVLLESHAKSPLAEAVAAAWRDLLHATELDVLHMHNSPPSALETHLTEITAAGSYAPLRLTVSQSFFLEARPWRWETLKKLLLDTLPKATARVAPEGATQ